MLAGFVKDGALWLRQLLDDLPELFLDPLLHDLAKAPVAQSPARAVNRDSEGITSALRASLEEVLGWQEGGWDEVAGGNQEVWSRGGKEAFEDAITYYPIPRA